MKNGKKFHMNFDKENWVFKPTSVYMVFYIYHRSSLFAIMLNKHTYGK